MPVYSFYFMIIIAVVKILILRKIDFYELENSKKNAKLSQFKSLCSPKKWKQEIVIILKL